MHSLYVSNGSIGPLYETVAAFPKGIGNVGTIALEHAGAEGGIEPFRTGDVVGIHLQHTGEVAPAKNIVEPLGVNTRHPEVAGFLGIAHLGVDGQPVGILLDVTVAGTED